MSAPLHAGLTILDPGPNATVQGAARTGYRHLGVPWSGPADALSLALGNRLLGNPLGAPGIEAVFGGLTVRFEADCAAAVTGASAAVARDGAPVPPHEVIMVRAGQILAIARPPEGARCTLAVAGGLGVPRVLGSPSTYVPAALGGWQGRALTAGDVLPLARPGARPRAATPRRFRPPCGGGAVLRTVPSGETPWLTDDARRALHTEGFTVTPRSDRMGLRLNGTPLAFRADAPAMRSACVLPGTLQLPPGGAPILLGPDAQGTGGYPRVAAVLSADRHLIGQLRPGDRVRFYPRGPDEAVRDVRAKAALWAEWLGVPWGC